MENDIWVGLEDYFCSRAGSETEDADWPTRQNRREGGEDIEISVGECLEEVRDAVDVTRSVEEEETRAGERVVGSSGNL